MAIIYTKSLDRSIIKSLQKPGTFGSARFIKKGDGSTRTMTYQIGVKKHLTKPSKGLSANQKAADVIHNNLRVYEIFPKSQNKEGQYRTIPVDNLLEIKAAGIHLKRSSLNYPFEVLKGEDKGLIYKDIYRIVSDYKTLGK